MADPTHTAELTMTRPAAVTAERRRLKPGSKMILEDLGARIDAPQLVNLVDIGSSGLTFEFDRFVHTGTACSLVLKTPAKAFMRMRGKISACDCPDAGKFMVSVRFFDRIDLEEIVGGH